MDPSQWTADEFVEPASTTAKDLYRQIRDADDVDALARNSGLDPEVIAEAKRNLFQTKHDVPLSPTDSRFAYFTPLERIGELWAKVAKGDNLVESEMNRFRSLIAHEYVEGKLLEAGAPYRSQHPGAWKEDAVWHLREHLSAHHLAPLSDRPISINLLRHWDGKFGRNAPEIAPDLSNLDEVVEAAKEILGL